jgi:hypothetical protein
MYTFKVANAMCMYIYIYIPTKVVLNELNYRETKKMQHVQLSLSISIVDLLYYLITSRCYVDQNEGLPLGDKFLSSSSF